MVVADVSPPAPKMSLKISIKKVTSKETKRLHASRVIRQMFHYFKDLVKNKI